MTRFLFLIVFVFGALISTYSQPKEVYGTIRNKSNQKPIAFANVFFQSDQGRGVISNERGEFRIKFGLEDGKDTLVFTELGFEPVYLGIADISSDTIQVFMKEQSLPLPEVTVFSDEKLRQIFREVLARLPDQYGLPNSLMRAYFREYSVTDSTYSEMLEAFVTIQDDEFNYPPEECAIFLKEFRRSLDERSEPIKEIQRYENGIYNLYERFPYILSRLYSLLIRKKNSFLNHYRFFNNGEYLEGKDTLIKIGLRFENNAINIPEGKSRAPYRMAELTVRKSDYGILKLRHGNPGDDSYSEINYQKVEGKYFPSRIQLVNNFSIGETGTQYLNTRQIHILHILDKEERKAIRYKKGRFLKRELDMRKIRYTYKEAFWDNNQILVTIPAPEALKVDLSRRIDLQEQFYKTSRGKRNN